VYERRAEPVLSRGRRIQRHCLDASRTTDGEVCQLGSVLDAKVVCQTLVRRVEQQEPHLFGFARIVRNRGIARVERKPRGLTAQVELDHALVRKVSSRQQTRQLAEVGGGTVMRGVTVLGSSGARGAMATRLPPLSHSKPIVRAMRLHLPDRRHVASARIQLQ